MMYLSLVLLGVNCSDLKRGEDLVVSHRWLVFSIMTFKWECELGVVWGKTKPKNRSSVIHVSSNTDTYITAHTQFKAH